MFLRFLDGSGPVSILNLFSKFFYVNQPPVLVREKDQIETLSREVQGPVWDYTLMGWFRFRPKDHDFGPGPRFGPNRGQAYIQKYKHQKDKR